MGVSGAQLPQPTTDGSGPVVDQPFGYSVPAVYEQLRALILEAKIEPGKATSQGELCSLTGASRTPVREALRMLQNEGLVVLVANRRMRIADISVEELEGLQAMRIALEGLAIRYTVGRLKREQLAELEGLMAQMEDYLQDTDFERHQIPHRAFHLLLVSHATETELKSIATLNDHMIRYRKVNDSVVAPETYRVRSAEHRAIADAARAGDEDAAASALVHHYLRTVGTVAAELKPGYFPERVLKAAQLVAPGEDWERVLTSMR